MTTGPFLERYLSGDHAQVWSDLARLPESTISSDAVALDAQAVAEETMSRVRQDCEELVRRLEDLGDACLRSPARRTSTPGIHPRPHPPTNGRCARGGCRDRKACRPVPVSLRSFWQHVGAIALVGQWPAKSATNDVSDPLWVYGPGPTLSDIRDFEGDADWEPVACIAPDYLHKGDISGGAPYSVRLGRRCADADVMGTPYEPEPTAYFDRPQPSFVSYLRNAILRVGWLPGVPANTRSTRR